MYSHYRKSIQDQFKCRVTDTYGCGEGIQVSAQCGSSDGGYHVFMPHVIVEYVDNMGHIQADEGIGDIQTDGRHHPDERGGRGDLRKHLGEHEPEPVGVGRRSPIVT